jgi:hypothetical protein
MERLMNDLKQFRIKTSIGSLALIAALGAIVESAHAHRLLR